MNIEQNALPRISELAKTLGTLSASALQDIGTDNDSAAELIVAMRELSRLIGWTCEVHGAGVFGPETFLPAPTSPEVRESDRGQYIHLEAAQ